MVLPIVYGNFLRKKSVTKAQYEINKPRIQGWINAFFMFSLAGCLVTGMFLGYEMQHGIKVSAYDDARFKEYRNFFNSTVKSVNLINDIKKTTVDVNYILNSFCAARTRDMVFTEITINPKKYVIRGQVRNFNSCDTFIKNLDFSSEKSVSLGKVNSKDGYVDFTVNVTEKISNNKTIGSLGKAGGKS